MRKIIKYVAKVQIFVFYSRARLRFPLAFELFYVFLNVPIKLYLNPETVSGSLLVRPDCEN